MRPTNQRLAYARRLWVRPLEDRSVPALFTVTNLTDGPVAAPGELPGSLRQAIFDAEASPDVTDTVVFQAGLTGTITLTAGILPTITTDVTVTGPGSAKITVNGNAGDMFDIDGTAALAEPNVSVTGLTLTNGKTLGSGAALFAAKANVTLDDIVATNNSAAGNGGAVAVQEGSKLVVANSTFSGNSISGTGYYAGGAVAVIINSTGKFTNSTFTNNSAGGSKGLGGAIGTFDNTVGVDLSSLEIVNSTLTGNTNGFLGGAIYHAGYGPIVVTGSTFTKNQASVSGGSILSGSSDATITNNTFDQSKALTSGGGAIRFGTLNGKTALVEGNTFTNNFSGNAGGAILISGTATGGAINIRNSTFLANSAPFGGAVLTFGNFDGILNIENSTMTGNSGSSGAGAVGAFGGTASTFNIVSSIIAGNSVAGNFKAATADIQKGGAGGAITIDFSLIGVDPGAIFTNPTPGSNKIGTTTTPLDPLLAPLTNYGGLTKTLLPLPGSPALNAGSNPAGLVNDQRGAGFPRNWDGIGGPDIGAVEAFNPTPSVSGVNAPAVTIAGGTSYEFSITFQDNKGIDVSTLDDAGAVTVSGGKFVTPVNATFVKVNDPINGSPRTATYAITPPGGSWDLTDNGTYDINITANTIFDIDTPTSLSVPGGVVGTFTVGLPQTFTVTTDQDAVDPTDGKLSLREALTAANASPGADTVNFDPAVFTADTTIFFLTANPLQITDSVSVLGPTAVKVTIDAGGLTTNHININGAGVIDVTLSKLTFTNGINQNSAGDEGGSILTTDENLTIIGCTFTNNTTQLDGGAVAQVGAGKLTIIDSVFVDNKVALDGLNSAGGAVSAEGAGTLTISNSTFTTNSADTTAGAIIASGLKAVTITGSTFTGNTNSGDGFTAGAILITTTLAGATAVIDGSTFTGNEQTATGAGGGAGGAIAIIGSPAVTVSNSTFNQNKVASGEGGAIWTRADSTATITVTNSKFTGNEAGGLEGHGGAIFANSPTASVTVTESTFSGNTAAVSGGAIAFNDGGSLTVQRSLFSANTTPGDGGGIGFKVATPGKTGTFTLNNSTLSGNSAGLNGGGLFLNGTGITAAVQNSTFTLNKLDGSGTIGGGGLAVSTFIGSTLKLASTILAQNIDLGATGKPDVASDTAFATTGSNNLIGAADGTGLTFGGTGHKTGTVAAPLDAKLNPLADNKGPTLTHSLQAASPALNAGNNDAALTSDQRGGPYVRVFGSQADIGAFEEQPLDPAITASVKVDDGTNQRSRITSLTVTFSAPVTFVGAPEAAFQLVQAGTANAVTLAAAVAGPVVTLTFSGPLTEATSLKDGNYQLTVFANQINGSFDGGGGPGTNLVFGPTSGSKGLFRLFGDSDGDRDVDFNDFLGFRGVFGQPSTPTGPGYYFNVDGNASIDFTDFLAFRTRFGTTLAP